MKEYVRTKLNVTVFKSEDVIATSDPVTRKTYHVQSPNYTSPSQNFGGSNWTLWQ